MCTYGIVYHRTSDVHAFISGFCRVVNGIGVLSVCSSDLGDETAFTFTLTVTSWLNGTSSQDAKTIRALGPLPTVDILSPLLTQSVFQVLTIQAAVLPLSASACYSKTIGPSASQVYAWTLASQTPTTPALTAAFSPIINSTRLVIPAYTLAPGVTYTFSVEATFDDGTAFSASAQTQVVDFFCFFVVWFCCVVFSGSDGAISRPSPLSFVFYCQFGVIHRFCVC